MIETKKPLGHLMVDIETFGKNSNSAIVSIAVVEFDINTGEIGREFYTNVSLKSCIDIGLKMNAETIMWWMRQSDAARKSIITGESVTIQNALQEFGRFIDGCGGKDNCQIWGNSARFDLGILSDAFAKISMDIPWDFRKERCVRTLLSFSPETKDDTEFDGIAHNALYDCRFQIKYCSKIWQKIKPFLNK